MTGARPSREALEARFEAWAADRVARMLIEARIDDLVALRVRPVDGSHEWIADSASSGTVVLGRTPILDFAVAYGDLAADYLREFAPLGPGRPSNRETRIEAILAAVRGGARTRLAAAQALHRVDDWGIENSGFKADVRAAGGWRRILERADF